MKEQNRIQILVVDDHPVVCYGLSALLDAQPDMDIVACCETGEQAVRLFQQLRPDVILMDLRMPGLSGLEAIRQILSTDPSARIVVLTTYDGDEDIYQALEAGAQGYLLKGSPETRLFEAVRRVYSGRRFVPPEITSVLASRVPDSSLTAREREVLGLIVKGLSNKAIGSALGISEGTVKTHVNIILAKLGVEDRTQAAVAALHRGLVHI